MKRSITGIAIALSLALGSWTIAYGADKEENEHKVKLKDLPEAVQKTVKEHAEGAKIGKIEKETENGQTYYEVHVKKNGKKQEFKVGLDGKYLGEENEEEHEKEHKEKK